MTFTLLRLRRPRPAKSTSLRALGFNAPSPEIVALHFHPSDRKNGFPHGTRKTLAAIAELSAAADNLIAKCGDHTAEIAQLQGDLANAQAALVQADDDAAAAIQAEADKINAALPPAA